MHPYIKSLIKQQRKKERWEFKKDLKYLKQEIIAPYVIAECKLDIDADYNKRIKVCRKAGNVLSDSIASVFRKRPDEQLRSDEGNLAHILIDERSRIDRLSEKGKEYCLNEIKAMFYTQLGSLKYSFTLEEPLAIKYRGEKGTLFSIPA
ncbi:hypothetical protein GF336_02315 [Candidatus Woesearchaeota archaeon]|nr:hypothetical protein [Candidatus Woesearchaeota archaeon]